MYETMSVLFGLIIAHLLAYAYSLIQRIVDKDTKIRILEEENKNLLS